MIKPALAIMARVPSVEGKSRLGGVLTPAQRVTLQWAFLEDTLNKARQMPEFKCFIAATPADETDKLTHLAGSGGEVIPQPEGSLGQRMLGIAGEIFTRGYSPVVLIGTDVPSLPPYFLLESLKLLDRYDLVLGPSVDGGYYLIGMRYLVDGVFIGIDWGTETVLDKTLSFCNRNNLTYSLLARLMDVDRPDDLLSLAEQIKCEQIELMPAPVKTIQFLKSIGRMK